MSATRIDITIGEAGKAAAQALGGELIITIEHGDVRYEGTAAQLQVEGFIPADLEWPRGRIDRHWCANGFRYWLRRARPAGHKGPSRSWIEGDNWRLTVQPEGNAIARVQALRLKALSDQLAQEIHCQSLEGQLERREQWDRICRANEDKVFQAFKSTFLPERKKPGRPPKSKAV